MNTLAFEQFETLDTESLSSVEAGGAVGSVTVPVVGSIPGATAGAIGGAITGAATLGIAGAAVNNWGPWV